MKDVARFTVGSESFFSGIDGFNPHDHDILYLMEDWSLHGKCARIIDGKNDCFLYPNKGKELINECIEQCDPITAGKFLVPELCIHIGAGLDDIKPLKPLFESIDEKHAYQKYIFDCYISNNGLWLTEDQLKVAYELYLSPRINRNDKESDKKTRTGMCSCNNIL